MTSSFYPRPRKSPRCIIGLARSAPIWRGLRLSLWVWWAYLLPVFVRGVRAGLPVEFPGHLRERLRLVVNLVGRAGGVADRLALHHGQRRLASKASAKTSARSERGRLAWIFDFRPVRTVMIMDSALLGSIGATIVYATLCLISLLFLTNFRLGEWIRGFLEKVPPGRAEPKPESAEEGALERRARELEKQAKKLQEEVARSGLGADMQPVPEPTVRDLSVPQAKPGRISKTTLPGGMVKEPASVTETPTSASGRKPAPAAEGEAASPREVPAATTEDILGKKSETEKSAETKSRGPEKIEPEKSPPNRRSISPTAPCRPNPKPNPKSRSRSPSPRRPSSAITSCRRWIFSSTRT